MSGIHHLLRFLALGALAAVILTGCITGDDDPEPTQTPIVVTSTPTESGDDAEDAEPTASLAPTDVAAGAPTTTPEATSEPTPTSAPSPTARPTQPVQPTATRQPITVPTPTATLPTTNGSRGGIEIPADLLTILPLVEDAPQGMVIVDEGPADLDLVASDFDDEAARKQQLIDWGFQGAAFREMELPADQIVDSDSQPIGFIARAMLLGSPDAARAEMNSFTEEIVLGDDDPAVTTEEVAIDPIGDAHRAIVASVDAGDGDSFNVVFLGVAAGPLSLQFIAAGGAQYDPLPDVIAGAQATLDYLGYAGTPALGEVLLETDFSTWPVNQFESGELFFGEDGFYHVVVNQGAGSFISAYSTDHEPFTDIAVSVDMRMLAGDPTSQGCVMTRVDEANQQYDYAFCVDGNGNVEALFEQFDADGNYSNEALLPGGIVTVPPPGADGTWTTLTIMTRGDEFWFLIDGELIHSVRHAGPPAGSVGVIVNHFAADPGVPAEFIFTNLVVQAVE